MVNSIEENSIKKDEEILNNIKTYMQESIDNGYHKFVYNDLGYEEKCIDVINAIEHLLSDYERVLKEANRYKNMYKAEHEIHLVRNEQLDRKENAVTKCNELIIENAKLKEENEYNKLLLDTNKNFTIDKKNGNYKWNVIEIQKIKDKIEELNKKEKELQNSISTEEREEYSDANISWNLMDIEIRREVLQELLESEE